MSQECARAVWSYQAPSEQYVDRVARQLLGTVAAESDGKTRRQHGFTPAPENLRGAFGLWQCEKGSVLDSLRWLSYRPSALERARAWLTGYGSHPDVTLANLVPILCHMQTEKGDALSCLFGRLHYARYPVAIPSGIWAQAGYWLNFYNGYGVTKQWLRQGVRQTEAEALGKAYYVDKWNRLCAPIAGESAREP